MSMSRPQGLGRDPKYPGKFGIPADIINTPQKPAQWWAVAALSLLAALPFGVWDVLDRAGPAAIAGYVLLMALTVLNAWFLRHDINEKLPYLSLAIGGGIALFLGAGFIAAFEAFPNGDWPGGVLTLAAALIAGHNTYRAWQGLLIIGVFTEQAVPPDSPYFKG